MPTSPPAPTTDTDMSPFASSCDSNDPHIKGVSELGMEPAAQEGRERRLKAVQQAWTGRLNWQTVSVYFQGALFKFTLTEKESKNVWLKW